MKLSHEKIIHLSHVVADALAGLESVAFNAEHNAVRLKIVDLLRADLYHQQKECKTRQQTRT